MMLIRGCRCNLSLTVRDFKSLLFLYRSVFNLYEIRINSALELLKEEQLQQADDFVLNVDLSDEAFYNLENIVQSLVKQKEKQREIAVKAQQRFRRTCIICISELIDMISFTQVHIITKHNENLRLFKNLVRPYVASFGLSCRNSNCLHCLIISYSQQFFDDINSLSPN